MGMDDAATAGNPELMSGGPMGRRTMAAHVGDGFQPCLP